MTAQPCPQIVRAAALIAVFLAEMTEAAKEAEATGYPKTAAEIDRIIKKVTEHAGCITRVG